MIDKESREYPVDLKRMLDIGLSLKTSDDKVLALQTRVTALHEIIQEQNKSVKPEPVVDSVRRASRMTPGMMRSHTSTTPHNPHNPTL
jgi:hypothetical protein